MRSWQKFPSERQWNWQIYFHECLKICVLWIKRPCTLLHKWFAVIQVAGGLMHWEANLVFQGPLCGGTSTSGQTRASSESNQPTLSPSLRAKKTTIFLQPVKVCLDCVHSFRNVFLWWSNTHDHPGSPIGHFQHITKQIPIW